MELYPTGGENQGGDNPVTAAMGTIAEPEDLVYAAGCVVWRINRSGRVKILLIHRPAYDDWSFPKGKRDEGETDLECARREVEEECGVVGEIGPELSPVHYVDKKGRDKVVRFWTMLYRSGEFVPNSEVDSIRWVKLNKVAGQLTRERESQLVEDFKDAICSPE